MFMTVNVKNQSAAISDIRSVASSSGNELLPFIQQDNQILIDASLLHKRLKAKTRFNDWITYRIREYGFTAHQDYFTEKSVKKTAGRTATNYLLTIDMAKELAMLERNETGRQIRRYFIAKEKELRGVSYLPKETALFKGLKPKRINDRELYPYSDIRERAGYSRHGGGSHRARYWMHFIKEGHTLYVTAEFALHLLRQKQVMNNRAVMYAAQPVLPLDFAHQAKGGGL